MRTMKVLLFMACTITAIALLLPQSRYNYTLKSADGCCSIQFKLNSREETEAYNLRYNNDALFTYSVTFNDAVEGTSDTTIETSQADAEYMVHVFQEWCYKEHFLSNN